MNSVVIATGIYPPAPGGPATHAKAYKDYLLKKGWQVRVLTYAGCADGVVCVPVELPRAYRYFKYLWELYKLSKGADVILGLDALGIGFPVWLVSKARGVPYVLRVGGDVLWERKALSGKTMDSMLEFYEHSKGVGLFGRIVSLVLRGAKTVVMPTVLLAKVYEDYYGVSGETLMVLPNPLPTKKELVVEEINEKVLVFASRLVAYKNLDRLIEAFARVYADDPLVRLRLFGSGPEEKRLREHIQKKGLEEVVVVARASHEEVLRTIQNAHLCVAPALTEFYPNYVMECLSYGVPFVISKEYGLPFAPADEAVFDPKNVDDMTRAIKWGLSGEANDQLPELVGVPDWSEYLSRIERLLTEQL